MFAARYEILDHLGSGASSSVDRATDRLLNKTVALKRLHKKRLNAEKILRFQQEAKILGSLRHPNLTCVLDCGVSDDNQPYLVMECEEGTTLEKSLTHGRLPLETAVGITLQICEAMAYVHNHDVIHRDLNTRNVMLVNSGSSDPIVKILDFGVARFCESEELNLELTRPGQIIGNPLYMSPEQARNKELDGRSDIYSLGCLLFHMLTGLPPYGGNSLMELVAQHTTAAVPRLSVTSQPLESDGDSAIARDAWDELERIIVKCMAKSPDDRFCSMDEVKQHLETVKVPAASIQREATVQPPSVRSDALKIFCALALVAFVFGGITWWNLNKSDLTPANDRPRPSPPLPSPAPQIPLDGGKTLSELKREIAQGKTRIELTWATLTPEYFEAISKAKSINNLILTHCTGVTKEDIEMLVKSQTRVRDLIIDGSDINDEGLQFAAKLRGLEVVRMRTCLVHTTSRGIGYLANSPTLTTINANDTRLDDKGAAALARCRTLTNLKMASSKVTNIAAASLSAAKQISILDFSDTKVDDTGLKYLWTLPELNMLFLRGLNITDAGLAGFKDHKALKRLFLARSKGITDGALETIKTIPNLESLDLAETSVTPKSLPALCKLSTLQFLNIAGLSFSGSHKYELQNSLPQCRIVDDVNYRKDE